MKKKAAEITLRPFERSDFKRLISWVLTPEAHGQWCGSFFDYPLDESRLQRYLDSASQPNTRTIFTALLPSGEPVGHVEISNIWPYLSSRLSRVLVAPDRRQLGIGAGMVSRAVTFSFDTHHVDRIDLGVDIAQVIDRDRLKGKVALAAASCCPSCLRRGTFSQTWKFCEKVRLKALFTHLV